MSFRIWASLDPFYEAGPYLGRIVANTGFLEALLTIDPFDQYHFFPPSQKTADYSRNQISKIFPDLLPKIKFFPRTSLVEQISRQKYYCFHLSDCINYPAHLARLRNRYSRRIFPITSITHSLSYSNYSHHLLKQLWPGWSGKEAIICSSRCGLQVLENYFSRLKNEYRLDPDFVHPGLVHIPLGIEARKLTAEVDQAREKKELLPGNKINVLCLGRLSCYSKMDILPILRGFQLASAYGLDLGPINLVLAGGVDRKDDTLKKLKLFAANIGLETMAFANPDNNLKNRLLAESDIFISLADNPQETFGLTILEAQAAGLAVIASDYSGYRELVQNQENGFLIPTLGPDNTELIDDLAPLLYDSESHLMLSQSCAADIHQLARIIALVISDSRLRQRTGQKARQNAMSYDWAHIIPGYVSLWEELNQKKSTLEVPGIPHPVQTRYAETFSGFPSCSWMDSAVSQSRLGQAVYRNQDHPVIYSGMAHLIDPQAIRMILFLSRSPVKTPILLARLSAALDMDPSMARIIFSWALKQGLLQSSSLSASADT